jgi:hypothetical protein
MVANNGDNTGVGVATLGDQLRRRRHAAADCFPLRCGCRDPWPCRHNHLPPSERMVDAAALAASHLTEAGLAPVFDQATLRALWRRGGDDRRLAQRLYDLAGGT